MTVEKDSARYETPLKPSFILRQVSNGWIVMPENNYPTHGVYEPGRVWVFNRFEDMTLFLSQEFKVIQIAEKKK